MEHYDPDEPQIKWKKYCGGDGIWTYRPNQSGLKHHSIAYFTGDPSCANAVTDKIFRVCANWIMFDVNRDRQDISDKCSPAYYPNTLEVVDNLN